MTRVIGAIAERALEKGGPGGAGAGIIDAAIEHGPAGPVGDQVGVDVVERIGQRQAEPQHAWRDLAPGAGLRRRCMRETEKRGGRAVEHAGSLAAFLLRLRHAARRTCRDRQAGQRGQAAGGCVAQRRGGRPRRRRVVSPLSSETRVGSPSSQARSIARVRCTRLFIVPTAQPAIAAASS